MTKPIGYFCSGAMPQDEGLIADMQSSWGSTFEVLNNAQRLWMLQSVGLNLFNADQNSTVNSEHDDEIEEAIERFDELSESDLLGLLEALVGQLKNNR